MSPNFTKTVFVGTHFLVKLKATGFQLYRHRTLSHVLFMDFIYFVIPKYL